ncbi:UNVERIFIED_CONTAM: hypothetical protein FKN15_052350 [Acipenser sinensis]
MNDAWRLFQLEKATGNPNHPFSKFGTGNKLTLETRPSKEGIDIRQELLQFHSNSYSSNLMALCVLGRGWVNTLVGGQKEGAKGFMFFIINVDLTEEGLLHVEDIIFHMFQYIQKLRTEGPQEWVFQECKDLNTVAFRFKDKERPRGYTSKVAGMLHYYPLEEVLAAEYLLEDFRPDLIEMVLDKLRPENMRVAVVSKSFEGQTDKTEEWYGTQYKQEALPEETIKKWQHADLNGKFKLPMKNEFIPTNFEIYPLEKDAPSSPSLIKDTAMSKVWFKQDDKFFLPKACLNFEFFSPFAYVDPLHCNMAYLYLELLKDSLNEYAYAAELAGLSYDLQNTIYGMYLSVKGYNDKQHILLKKIVEKMATFEIDERRFDIIKEAYMRSLNNFRAEQPHQHAMYYLRLLMTEVAWTKDELKEALDDVTLPRLKAFIPQLLSRLHIEALLHGNITKQAALGMMQMVEDKLIEHAHIKPLLPSQLIRYREVQVPDALGMMQMVEDKLIEHAHIKPLLPSQLIRYREVQVPDRGWFVYQQRNEVHNNCGIEIYYQTDMQNTHENMLLELFCQIISEPCFNTLRTKEQLGYIVFSGPRRANGVQGLRFIIQSEKAPHYLESRVEAFLKTMEKSIEEMLDEAFQKHIQALAIRRLDKPKKLGAECAKYWGEIISQQYNFDRGYIVFSGPRRANGVQGLRFIIQSEKAPHYLESRVEAFLKTMEKSIEEMLDEAFQKHIQALAIRRLDKPKKLGAECAKYWGEIISQQYNFDRDNTEVAYLKTLTKENVMQFYRPIVVQNMTEFKRSLPLFPLAKPHINFMAAKL